ncbi:hypothetical protein TRFO_06994 [Tritrichomonas foetus]|uniref:Uncharacterized protein n=1 Tax=Tritrichomonas foetus TaxID=1144522 RepID=A0A1J4JYL7_9EUKA|nr:hypothetical protein TRFO_06994 [Tritrichomonas foetus]|eukprot:OHT02590.1 hypothetical protein TRFO_06994 [Tritrichomonas foetus]
MNEESIPKTFEELKNQIDIYLEDLKRTVSTIYTTYVRPFCEVGGNFEDFLIPFEDLIKLPPNSVKLRKFLFHIFTKLDIYHQKQLSDPLPEKEFNYILTTIRMVSPLAMAINESSLPNFIYEIENVHFRYFPQTIEKYKELLGLALKEPKFQSVDNINQSEIIARKHYHDAAQTPKKVKPKINVPTIGYSILPHQKSNLNHTVHVRMRRPKHGPNSKVPPSSSSSLKH